MASNPDKTFLTQSMGDWKYRVFDSPDEFYVDFEDYFEPGTFSPEDIARLNETDGKTTAGRLQINQQCPLLGWGKDKKPMQKVSVHIIFYGMYFKDHASMEVFAKRTVQSKEFQEKYPAK
ncbi:hypothetical protein FNF29_08464 [Cafeteria roenbergensis]|uniref:Uncharacterized protein n=1 Tax=Cafeteria roenbergensis TaxID=33653 RepID=A0A5A8C0Z7_CAFRO|nr:hypothetical protein FNF29_08464 [Cafeteria roenbergensis]|eukprot:KAA0145611.1 hypothetical protein FNF29_08464 [Cafeteria roenbergensis]